MIYSQYIKLFISLIKNNNEIPNDMVGLVEKSCLLISELNFNDAIVQYDSISNAIHYNLFFEEDIELSIIVYKNETEACFYIYHNGNLITDGYNSLNNIIVKAKQFFKNIM